jgi:predicted nucleic acid-binding protein
LIVVDASLAAKWMVEEAQSPAANSFLRRFATQLTAPSLITAEVGGAIVRRSNAGEFSSNDAMGGLERWVRLIDGGAPMLQPVTSARLLAAGRLATALRHPLKDCVYLALAMELSIDLATCDARFAAKARALYLRIKLLGDYELPDSDGPPVM